MSREDEYVPTPLEVYDELLPELEATQTKEEAREVAAPLMCVAAIYWMMSEDDDMPFGGMTPLMVARVTPLTEEDVEDEIEKEVWNWAELPAKEEKGLLP